MLLFAPRSGGFEKKFVENHTLVEVLEELRDGLRWECGVACGWLWLVVRGLARCRYVVWRCSTEALFGNFSSFSLIAALAQQNSNQSLIKAPIKFVNLLHFEA